METVFDKLDAVRQADPVAVAMDIDAAGLPFLKGLTPPAGSKTVEEGYRATAFFVIQMADAEDFSPNDETDPAFGVALRQAAEAGVEIADVYKRQLPMPTVSMWESRAMILSPVPIQPMTLPSLSNSTLS